MLDNDDTTQTDAADLTDGAAAAPSPGPQDDVPEPESAAPKKVAAKKTAKKAAAKKTAKKSAAKKTAAKNVDATAGVEAAPDAADAPDAPGAQVEIPAKKAAKKTAKKSAAKKSQKKAASEDEPEADSAASGAPAVLFQAPEKAPEKPAARKKAASRKPSSEEDSAAEPDDADAGSDSAGADGADDSDDSDDEGGESGNRRRRRRGGRRRRKPGGGTDGDEGTGSSSADGAQDAQDSGDDEADSSESDDESAGSGQGGESSGSRRRRRRRRPGEDGDSSSDEGQGGPRARRPRNPEDEITSIGGSTRLEAKKQRRREGREAGRRRAPIVSEAEFLARRESVDRVMVIRQREDLTQIAVLEDKVLVEHYVARESQTSLIGNVYLGRVQNVLPSMEAAFIDIGKGRNAVLYAGEVNWSALGHKDGQPRKVESVLSSGQTILVQVTKDPVGHKGARLTGQVSLPGRFLVYVPEGNTSGISRKLPDTERNRLKTLLKEIVPDTAGVIVRTAAEGASEDELTQDVERLTARWGDIEEKVKAGKGPQLLYGEPDLTLKVVRDLFTEDFSRLVIQGDDAWELVNGYVSDVAPDLRERLERFGADDDEEAQPDKGDVFASYRVDEQIAKGVDRKVWLPSGGSLIIDRTEAMTVVDVNTGKFTGSGGNLEETVTKNNLEAAEEIVRQLRLRDIGGIIVVDFIDMVLESNRDLVLRRLVECLGRDRTRHQVAEVTSLGLVQMTRKRIGTGLLEAFSTECEHCKGRGLVVHEQPVEHNGRSEDDEPRGRRARGGRNNRRGSSSAGGPGGGNGGNGGNGRTPSPADLAASRPPQPDPEDEAVAEPGSDVQEPDTAEPHGVGTPAATDAEPIDVPSETGRADAQQDDAPQSQPDAPQESESEAPQEVQPEEPAAPRVVTRRRSARRPAGPPAVSEEISMPGAGTQSGPSAEPVAVPVDPGSDEAVQDDLEDDEDSEDSNAFSLLHVPVKRRGRKR